MEHKHDNFRLEAKRVYRMMVIAFAMLGIFACILLIFIVDPSLSSFTDEPDKTNYTNITQDQDWDKIENGIHLRTGLIAADGLMETVNNCTNCHSAKLVTQNRMTAQRWAATIVWMQETQNLWDLGPNQEIIINYLVTNYPVANKGRRQALQNIDWYELED